MVTRGDGLLQLNVSGSTAFYAAGRDVCRHVLAQWIGGIAVFEQSRHDETGRQLGANLVVERMTKPQWFRLVDECLPFLRCQIGQVRVWQLVLDQ